MSNKNPSRRLARKLKYKLRDWENLDKPKKGKKNGRQWND